MPISVRLAALFDTAAHRSGTLFAKVCTSKGWAAVSAMRSVLQEGFDRQCKRYIEGLNDKWPPGYRAKRNSVVQRYQSVAKGRLLVFGV